MPASVLDASARLIRDELWCGKRAGKITFHGGEPLVAGVEWYRIGKIDGSTAVMLLGEDIFVILSFGQAATLPVPHVSCAFEVEGKEHNSADIAVSSDGSAVSWVFKTVAYPETIIIRDRTGVEVCSFKVDDIPQTP